MREMKMWFCDLGVAFCRVWNHLVEWLLSRKILSM